MVYFLKKTNIIKVIILLKKIIEFKKAYLKVIILK